MPKLRALDFRTEPFAPRFYDSDPAGSTQGALVLLPGTFGSVPGHFGLIFPALATQRRVIGLDFQPTEGPLEVGALAAQVCSLIDGLGLTNIDLCGYSLGGVIATQVAAQRGQDIRRLVLLASWAQSDTHIRLRNDLWHSLRAHSEADLRIFTALSVFAPNFLSSLSPAQVRSTLSSVRFTDFGDQQMHLNRNIDIRDAASLVTAETLVLSCAHDAMIPLHHQEQLVQLIPDSHLEILLGGHGIVFEDPDAVIRAVQEFLS